MQKKEPLTWIPIYVDKWLFGSTRDELAADEMAVWADFLCLAAKDDGYIRANVGFPYSEARLAGLLGRPEELIHRTIEKCLRTWTEDPNERPKLTRLADGTLYITNWEEYQFSDRHSRRFLRKKAPVSGIPDAMSGKAAPIVEDRIVKESIEKKKEIAFCHTERAWQNITEEDKKGWAEAFPACDIDVELAKAREWILGAGPRGQKRAWRKFFVGWLTRAQRDGGTRSGRGEYKVSQIGRSAEKADEGYWAEVRRLKASGLEGEALNKALAAARKREEKK